MDAQILLYINSLSTPWLDSVMLTVTHFGDVATVLLVTFFVASILYRFEKYQQLLFLVTSIAGALVVNSGLKLLFARQRPDLWELLTHESTFSFPSGHAALSSALALSIIILVWKTRWRWLATGVGAVYVIAIGFSRMYLGVHYPSDVLAGWFVSAICVYGAYKLTSYIYSQRNSNS